MNRPSFSYTFQTIAGPMTVVDDELCEANLHHIKQEFRYTAATLSSGSPDPFLSAWLTYLKYLWVWRASRPEG